jgi:hypothetical protein
MRFRFWIAVALALIAAVGILVFAWRQAAFREALSTRSGWAVEELSQRVSHALSAQRITAVHVAAALDPGEGRFSAKAELQLEIRGDDAVAPALLLHESLRVDAVHCDDTPVFFRREGFALLVEQPLAPGPHTITVDYRLTGIAADGAPGRVAATDVLLPGLSLWYPVDLQSSHAFTGEVLMPATFRLITSGTIDERRASPARQTVIWREPRPLFAAPLIVGEFALPTGPPGPLCVLAAPIQDAATASSNLAPESKRIYHYLQGVLGPAGFEPPTLLETLATGTPQPVGAGTVLVPSGFGGESAEQFVSLAEGMARLWWGERVGGRWFDAEAEGGRWLTEALSQYFALEALRDVRGPKAWLQYLARHERPWTPGLPLKDQAMRAVLSAGEAPADFAWQGAQAVGVIADALGREQFNAACKRFLLVHEGKSVSVDALISELESASGQKLAAEARDWLSGTAAPDYALGTVVAGATEVHLEVLNPGGLKAMGPLQVALFVEDRIQIMDVPQGVAGRPVALFAGGVVSKIVLDPFLRVPDADRRNNIWPGAIWPTTMSANETGTLAIGFSPLPNTTTVDRLLVVHTTKGYDQRVVLGHRVEPPLLWQPGTEYLAMGGPYMQTWSGGTGTAIVRSGPGRLLGWRAEACWVLDEAGKALEDFHSGKRFGAFDGAVLVPGGLREGPGGEDVFLLSENGAIVSWRPGARTIEIRSASAHAAGDFAWSSAAEAWVTVDRERGLAAVGLLGGERLLTPLSYPVTQSRVSAGGNCAAWLDPSGTLRGAMFAGGAPQSLPLAGEVVDFTWSGEETLFVLTAEAPDLLPTRFHATYWLWRVSTSDWKPVRLGSLAAAPDGAPYLDQRR